jgi:hypothetical protein
MSKIEEYKSELVRIQEIAILDTIDLVERGNDCDKETKVGVESFMVNEIR